MKYLIKEDIIYSALSSHTDLELIDYKISNEFEFIFKSKTSPVLPVVGSYFRSNTSELLKYMLIYDKDKLLSLKITSTVVGRINVQIYIDADVLLHLCKTVLTEQVKYIINLILANRQTLHNMTQKDLEEDIKGVCIPEFAKHMVMEHGQPECMTVRLYNYQLKTMNWMIEIEKQYDLSLTSEYNSYSFYIPINDIFLTKIDDKYSELSKYKINLVDKKICYEDEEKFSMTMKGGILADEMGLGKTITIIGLLVSKQMEDKPIKDNLRFNTKANLIFCPSQLVKQWESEILRANPLMKVVICLTKMHHAKLCYRDLVDADVVIVSYQFMCNHKYYANIGSEWKVTPSSFVHNKQHHADREQSLMRRLKIINELALEDQLDDKEVIFEFMNWYRIIIDEGHEIYGQTINSSSIPIENLFCRDLINMQKTRFKWYVSGTPFVNENGFASILNFIEWKSKVNGQYLDYYQVCNKGGRDKYLRKEILNSVLYRNTKSSIGEEYNVPPVTEDVMLLDLTEFERHVYNQYLDAYNQNLANAYNRHGININEEKLRQICCHLQFINNNDQVENISLSLEDVRQSLIIKYSDELKKLKVKLGKLKEDKNEEGKQNKPKTLQNTEARIKQLDFHINFFEKIEPIVAKIKEDDCSICYGTYNNLVVTECSHFYCKECIYACLRNGQSLCPMCRTPLTAQKIHPIHKLVDNNNQYDSLSAKYGTKMGKLMQICRKLFNNPDNKIIIFSQWDIMLTAVMKTLKENDIDTVCCKGNVHQRNKAIKAFKKDIRVIMLSLEHSASGINLTEATHIILIDPISGSKEEANAIENQAIGRSYRLGQNKSIKVIRLIVNNTIEHEIYQRNKNESVTVHNAVEQFMNQL